MFILFIVGCEKVCINHIDENNDYKCDICQNIIKIENNHKTHIDEDEDNICDICGDELNEDQKCKNHVDEDKNNICDICLETVLSTIKKVKTISTKKNDSFFPTKRSDLDRKELTEAYEKYLIDKNINLESWGEYVIYNLISEEKSKEYDLDIFEVYYPENSLYLMKYKEDIYHISPFDQTHANSHCLNHIAITDINDDGYIEILTAIVSFSQRINNYYCSSTIYVTDTYTKLSVEVYGWKNINYFKENSDGVMCIYKTADILPVKENLNNGKLDEKYYDLAELIYETPQLNIINYEFKEKIIKASCDLYEVEITINDYQLNFPYIFGNTYTIPAFKVKAKMTYLGETFIYTNGTNYLDGATVSFVNGEEKISYEGWGEYTVVTKFVIFNGMVIEQEYNYPYYININPQDGTYDMIINYNNKHNNIDESIIIEDFLKISR